VVDHPIVKGSNSLASDFPKGVRVCSTLGGTSPNRAEQAALRCRRADRLRPRESALLRTEARYRSAARGAAAAVRARLLPAVPRPLAWGAGKISPVDRTHRRAHHQVWRDPVRQQLAQHADLHRAEATSARRNESSARASTLSNRRTPLTACRSRKRRSLRAWIAWPLSWLAGQRNSRPGLEDRADGARACRGG
jgi:hypothetical protein